MNTIQITPHTTLKPSQGQLLTRFLREGHRLSHQEWQMLRGIIDQLGHSEVIFQGQKMTFKQFYSRIIDRSYSHTFLHNLYNLKYVMQEGQQLRATTAREIIQWFRQTGFVDRQTNYASYLVAVYIGGALLLWATSLSYLFFEN